MLLATACSTTERSTPAGTRPMVSNAAPVTASSLPASSNAPPMSPTSDTTDTSISTTTSTTISTTTSTTTSTTIETSTTVPGLRILSLAFTGDILPHSPLWRRAATNAAEADNDGYDFTPMLIGLAPIFDTVDLAICHLETPIAPAGEQLSTSPFYGVPAEVTDAIAAAGYKRCSTASNHSLDRGNNGIDRTVDELERVDITQTGMARIPDEIAPTVIEVDGVALSHLSYTWSFNGLTLPTVDAWRSALIDPERIIADAATARAMGAEVVVVSLHWGAEGVHEPTRYQRDIAEQLTASGLIDLIVGHHAHVVQPIEQINGTWVVFGLGNVLSNLPTSNRWPAASQDAVVVTIDIAVDDTSVSVGRPVAIPTWVDKDAGWVIRVVDTELARDDLSAGQRGRLEQSRERTTRVLGDFVAEDPPDVSISP